MNFSLLNLLFVTSASSVGNCSKLFNQDFLGKILASPSSVGNCPKLLKQNLLGKNWQLFKARQSKFISENDHFSLKILETEWYFIRQTLEIVILASKIV